MILALAGAAAIIAAAGALIGLAAAVLVARHLAPERRRLADIDAAPGVSVLKPLHGAGPRLAADLKTFLDQDCASHIQMLCGVASPNDPAAAAVAALSPGRAWLVVTGEPAARNRKVGNLAGLVPHALHEVLVISDSDIAVPRDYLRIVVGALSEPGVGAVTCLYTGTGEDDGAPGALWSRLAAMDIGYRFLPNAVFGHALGLATPCFGSTIALRRETLARIGGFSAFAEVLADDYEIGRAVRRLGLRIAIPPLTVAHRCHERRLADLITHELRWARTIRRIDPGGHLGSLVLHPLPFALIAAALALAAGLGPLIALAPPALAVAARLAQRAIIVRATGETAGPGWLLPARDVLSFAIFLASFMGDTVVWSGRRYRVRRDGVLSELQEPISNR